MLDLVFDLQTVLIFVAVFCVVIALVKAMPPRSNYPPGPPLTPFMGNLKYVTGNIKMHETFNKLAKEYGPIYSLQLGWYNHIVISDYNLIKEALVDNGDKFSGRYGHILVMRINPYANKGILLSEGNHWKATKRLALSSLRDFGFGKNTTEQRILKEADVLLQEIGKYGGKPFKLDLLFNKATANVMCAMLFGKRFDYTDPDYISLLNDMNFLMQDGFIQLGPKIFLPYALPLVFLSPNTYRNRTTFQRMGIFLKKQILEHRQNFDSSNIKDFVDAFLEAEQMDAKDEVTSDANMFVSILDLMLAGSETASTTMLWAVLFMMLHPEVQDRCRQEIMEVLGADQRPSLADRERLPYVDAVICEIQRLGNIAPHVQRCVRGTTHFRGYTLPDRTIVTPDVYSVHRDPKLWKDPEQFNPERFLDENHKVVRPPYFLPFGIGKRLCLGENLAKSELFLFFTSLIQNYRLTCEDKDELPTIHDAKMGVTLFPGQYEVMATALNDAK